MLNQFSIRVLEILQSSVLGSCIYQNLCSTVLVTSFMNVFEDEMFKQ